MAACSLAAAAIEDALLSKSGSPIEKPR